MKKHIFELGFFYLLTLVVFVFLFFILKPFLTPVFLAVVFASVFYPVHKKIDTFLKKRKNLSSSISVLLLVIIIILPLLIALLLLIQEVATLYASFSADGFEKVSHILLDMNNFFDRVLPSSIGFNISSADIQSTVKIVLGSVVQNANAIFSSALSFSLGIFLFIISLFYFFKEGDSYIDKLVAWSPLPDTSDRTIVHKISKAFNSVLRGNLITAVVQGSLAGVGFTLAGVGSPILLGFIAIIASFVPSIGTGIIIVPVIIYLYVIGSYGWAIFLLLWAVLVVGLVDNLLRPVLMEKGISVHPFLILLSVLGGIAFLGPIGLIAGPVLISIAVALLDLHPQLIIKDN